MTDQTKPGLVKRGKRAVRRVTRGIRHAVVEHSPGWIRRSLGPAATYVDMLFVDHGIFRVFYLNKHKVAPGVYRSAQPTPRQIARLARRGVKTIVNLRGPRMCGSYYLEKEACAKAGIRLIDFTVYSRAAPSPRDVHAAAALFDEIEYPMLMHCKSGADRAGLMSALYVLLHEGKPVEQAMRQLSLRYGHMKQADTGVLDYFFERYLADATVRPMPFLQWVDTVYDHEELKRTFRAKGWANRVVNSILVRE